ncbi:hypothetical protein MBLNU230_g7774t2 [Neophaeotheca triangularis]
MPMHYAMRWWSGVPIPIRLSLGLLDLFLIYRVFSWPAQDAESMTLRFSTRLLFNFLLFLAVCQLYFELGIYRFRWLMSRECAPPPAYPQKDPIFGIDLFRRDLKALKERRFLAQIQERFQTMKANTFTATALGRKSIITIEPENLKVIQAKDHKKWSLGTRRKIAFQPLLGKGIFTTDGAEWHHSREMLRPNFTRTQVGDLPTFERHVAHLISAVPRDGSTVDLSELFFRLTIDSATEFLFGSSTESLTKGSSAGFAEAFTTSQDHIANMSRWGKVAALFPTDPNFDKNVKFVHDFVDYYVDQTLARRPELLVEKSNADKKGRYVFMEEMVRQTDDRIRIRSECLNILLAGRDTTASLLTNTFSVLSKRPDIWQRLQDELAPLCGDAPSFDQLKDLKYLRAILNESLRLHPVVPVNSREALEDTTLPRGGGPDGTEPIFVPQGRVVGWSPYVMHRRKDFYGADAEDFKPERWLDDPATGKKGLRPGWEYLPFNGGARICLGQQFALNEASYTATRICQAFAGIESRDPNPWEEGLTLTCVNLHGAKVALTERS